MYRKLSLLGAFLVFAATALPTAGDDSHRAAPQRQAFAATRLAFKALTEQPGVRTGLVLATAPRERFRAFRTQMQGIAPQSVASMPMRAASIGKVFTGTIVLQLVEEGRLRLDQPLGELLSDADMPAGYTLAQLHAVDARALGACITLRQLLNHTSGLADVFFDRARTAELPVSFAERYIYNVIGALPERLHQRRWQGGRDLLGYYFAQNYPAVAVAAPGQRYHYSDVNYFLLGLIIERITAQPLAQSYRQRIFEPLRLSSAEFEWYEARRNLPMPHSMNIQAFLEATLGAPPRPLPPELANADVVALGLDTSFDWAGGGIMLSANDLDTFLRALLRGALFKHASTLRLMQTGVAMPQQGRAYGLGLMMRRDAGGMVCYGHDAAWGIEAWHCPKADVGLVLATNQLVSDTDRIASPLLAALLRAFR